MNNFERIKKELTDCISNTDLESAYSDAVGLLKEIALNTSFSSKQRKKLIAIFNKIKTWY